MASLTKVVATTSVAMKLYEEGKLPLDAKVTDWIPEFDNNEKGAITIRNLLLHNSGLAPDYPFESKRMFLHVSSDDILEWTYNSVLDYKTGTSFVYSDLSMVVLQQVMEKITGKPLNIYVKEAVMDKLGLKLSGYLPALKY
jgi:CubicO group peptidase (beta-lactamase class C family)